MYKPWDRMGLARHSMFVNPSRQKGFWSKGLYARGFSFYLGAHHAGARHTDTMKISACFYIQNMHNHMHLFFNTCLLLIRFWVASLFLIWSNACVLIFYVRLLLGMGLFSWQHSNLKQLRLQGGSRLTARTYPHILIYSQTLAKDHLDRETTLLLRPLFTSPV